MNVEILFIILLSLAPGIEARGAFPLAYVLGYQGFSIFLLIFLSSTLPSIPIIYGLGWLEEKIVNRVSWINKIYVAIIARIRRRAKQVTRYRIVYLGLILYVAIPSPGTGVWTGSLISYLLGLDKTRSVIAVAIGNFIACTIIYLTIYSVTILL